MRVPTCIGCGAMGRAARCEGECSEHKLLLVDAGDFDALQEATQVARARVAILAPVARMFADAPRSEQDCGDAYRALRRAARDALHRAGPGADARDLGAPTVLTGWWCATCGNVDAPQPCIDVCVWRETDWVNAAVYADEHQRSAAVLRESAALTAVLGRVVAVAPRDGHCRETWRALQLQVPAVATQPEA